MMYILIMMSEILSVKFVLLHLILLAVLNHPFTDGLFAFLVTSSLACVQYDCSR